MMLMAETDLKLVLLVSMNYEAVLSLCCVVGILAKILLLIEFWYFYRLGKDELWLAVASWKNDLWSLLSP